MTKRFYHKFLLPLLIFSFIGCAHDPKVSLSNVSKLGKNNNVSVIDFTDAPGAEAGNSGYVVANSMVSELLKIQGFTVVERKKIRTVIEEYKLSMSGLIDNVQAIKLGKLLGVNIILLGSVSQYRTSTIPVFLGLFTYYKDVYTVAANVRIVSVETGEVVFSGEDSATSFDSYQDAAGKIAQRLISHLKGSF